MTNVLSKYILSKEYPSEFSLDSLKLRIPLDLVSKITDELTATRLVVNSFTGEVERKLKSKGVKVDHESISLYYGIERQVTADQSSKDYLVMLFNSKLLKSKYLEGIRLSNIEQLYKDLISLISVDFSYEDFLNGECTDIDFKKDVVHQNFDKTIRVLANHAKQHARKDYGYRTTNKPKNKGIEFSDRNKSTPGNPFLKFYSKSLELDYNSKQFKDSFLSDIEVSKDLVRIEFTIKNKRHFRRYNIENTTLRNILSLDAKVKDDMSKDIVSIHLEKRLRQSYNIDGLSPTDTAIVTMAKMLLEQGLSFDVVKDSILNNIDKRSSKHSLKERLETLYLEVIQDTKEDKISQEQEKFFKVVGW